jgi:hypothetical protein
MKDAKTHAFDFVIKCKLHATHGALNKGLILFFREHDKFYNLSMQFSLKGVLSFYFIALINFTIISHMSHYHMNK